MRVARQHELADAECGVTRPIAIGHFLVAADKRCAGAARAPAPTPAHRLGATSRARGRAVVQATSIRRWPSDSLRRRRSCTCSIVARMDALEQALGLAPGSAGAVAADHMQADPEPQVPALSRRQLREPPRASSPQQRRRLAPAQSYTSTWLAADGERRCGGPAEIDGRGRRRQLLELRGLHRQVLSVEVDRLAAPEVAPRPRRNSAVRA